MTKLISDEYRDLNTQLHETRQDYGTSGQKYAQDVGNILRSLTEATGKTPTVLDYGCGKRTLSAALPHFLIVPYDPCIPEFADDPEPADILVCTDVLEHIEPELLDNVLDHMASLSRIGCFLTVATGPAVKVLADGRNAHLIQEGSDFWIPKILERWQIVQYADGGEELKFTTSNREMVQAATVAA